MTKLQSSTAVHNLLADQPSALNAEQFDNLLQLPGLRIERIASMGQASAADHWYDQDEHEWLMLLQGRAQLQLQDGSLIQLNQGDSYFLPAHCRHRVHWTDPEQLTLWLAVFISPKQ